MKSSNRKPLTPVQVDELIAELTIVLGQRAVQKGMVPGSKMYLSYVCGTRDRERKRIEQKAKLDLREAQRRD